MLTKQQQLMLAVMGTSLVIDPRGLPDPMKAQIKEDLQSDSLDVVEMVMSLEEAFKIEITDEDIEKIDAEGATVQDCWDLIAPKLPTDAEAG